MEKSEKKNNTKKKTKWGYWLLCILFCLALGIVATIVVNSMIGTTSTSGGYPEAVKSVSLSCENTGLAYPIFTYDNSNRKETKITATFSSDKLNSISLVHSLYYSDSNSVIGSEAHNHAAMNINFGENRLEADSFSATYSKSDTRMQMTLFGKNSDFENPAAKKYFLLDDSSSTSLEDVEKNYEKKGFSCSLSN